MNDANIVFLNECFELQRRQRGCGIGGDRLRAEYGHLYNKSRHDFPRYISLYEQR